MSLDNIVQLAQLGKPLVWTLHDMWAFTGGCHYSGGCDHFLQQCGQCPFLRRPHASDLSHKIWERKARALAKIPRLTILTPSRWLRDLAQQSPLLGGREIICLPNAIDTQQYQPCADRETLRQSMQLPTDRKLILFIAANLADPKKGFRELLQALDLFRAQSPSLAAQTDLLLVGKADPSLLAQLPAEQTHYLGQLHDQAAIARAYSAADVFAMPSLEDNLPNTIMESMACGTPVVAFKTGGIPEMILHGQTGYLANYKDTADFAQGLAQVVQGSGAAYSKAARQWVLDQYAYPVVAQKWLDLYERLLKG